MENKKDIGKAFREKIDRLEKSPSPKVWDSINAELRKKKKRRLLPFWIKTIGIAVLFLFLLLPFSTLEWSTDFPFYKNSKIKTTEDNNTSNDTNGKNTVTSTSNSENLKSEEERNALSTFKANSKKSDDTHRKNKKENTSLSEKSKSNRLNSGKNIQRKSKGKASDYSSALAKNKNKKKHNRNKSQEKAHSDVTALGQNENTAIAQNQKDYSANAETDLALTEKKKDSLKEKKKEKKPEVKDEKKTVKDSIKPFSKFYVFGYVNPTYYGVFSNESSIDSRLENNKTSGEFMFNFGGYIGVKITERLNLRLGVSRTKFSTTTKNVNFNTSNFENIKYKPGISNGSIATELNNENADIREEYSFLEIPFEIKYVLLDRKIGIETIGGFSTLHLNKSTIEVEKNNQSILIGQRNDLLKVHFTLNLGAGFYYKITKDLRFNAEPIFKYHVKTSEESSKKISFGIQTGLQYNLNN